MDAGQSLVCVVVVILYFNQILVSLGPGFSEYSEVASKLDALGDVMAIIRDVVEDHNISLEHGT